MALYLVQHGKSLPKAEDPEKGLSADGKMETERIADVAKGYLVKVSRIVHSGKKRARETAEILASLLPPAGGLEPRNGMNPLDDVRTFADSLELDKNVMLVGHLPFLERLIGLTSVRQPGPDRIQTSKQRHPLPRSPSRNKKPGHPLGLDAIH